MPRTLLLISATWLLTSCVVAPDPTDSATPDVEVGAWITYWQYDQGLRAALQNSSRLADLFFFVAHLDAEGRPKLSTSRSSLVADVNSLSGSSRSWVTVVNDVEPADGGDSVLKDPRTVHDILDAPARRAQHRQQLVQLALDHGFAGLDIDYENIWARDRVAFSEFIKELGSDLHSRGLLLSVTVQPKTRDRIANGAGAMDWGSLCDSVDRLQIMLYNLHYKASGPGPIATPEWVRTVLTFATAQCEDSRIVPVFKVSGMDWGEGTATGVTYRQAVSLARQHSVTPERDTGSQVPYFKYTTSGFEHTVFFEDATSLLAKVNVAAAFDLGAIVFWSLGAEDPSVFSRIDALQAAR